MIYQSATQIAEAIRRRDLTSEEITRAFLERIDQQNGSLQAIVADNREDALATAKAADRQQDAKRPSLHGVPVTVKESFNMRGLRTTVNFPPLKNYFPEEDSIIVKRLRDAGAVILGKTNVPTLLSDAQTFGPLYPTCNNPYDLSKTPGGSTGGGAAAVAAGMTTLEIGSDIGGSIRNPSHFCGLFGLKPTQNGHIQDGHIPPLPNRETGFTTMNSTGPLARCMDDIKLAYDICYKPRWDYQRFLPVAVPHPMHDTLKKYRVGWIDHFGDIPCGESTQRALAKMCQTLSAKGARVENLSIDLDLARNIIQLWAKLFGFVVGQDFNWAMRQILKAKFNKDIKGSRIASKKALRDGLSLDFKKFSLTLREQQEYHAEFHRHFEHVDFIISPVSAGPAFPHNPRHSAINLDGQPIHYSDYCFGFVMPFNVLGNPSLTVPTGPGAEGLPIGLQIIAPSHAEQSLIHFGKLIEAEGFGFQAPQL